MHTLITNNLHRHLEVSPEAATAALRHLDPLRPLSDALTALGLTHQVSVRRTGVPAASAAERVTLTLSLTCQLAGQTKHTSSGRSRSPRPATATACSPSPSEPPATRRRPTGNCSPPGRSSDPSSTRTPSDCSARSTSSPNTSKGQASTRHPSRFQPPRSAGIGRGDCDHLTFPSPVAPWPCAHPLPSTG